MSFTCLPRRVSQCLRVLAPGFHPRHQRVFSWLVGWPLVDGERATLNALARPGPPHLAYQHSRRWLCAAYWCTKTWRWGFAAQALQALPPPAEGLRSRGGDSTLNGQRGAKHPVAHQTRLSQYHPDIFGFRIVLLMAPWEV
jgi:hypothetical protein